jgi:hypothetical protein
VVWCCWNISAILQNGGQTPEIEPRGGRAQEDHSTTARIRQVEDTVETSVGQQSHDDVIAFLQRWDWDWFCTLTFPQDVHPEAADKRFRAFVMQLNRALYGRRWLKHGQGVQWARALEYQGRGAIHYHALLTGTSGLRPRDCAALWHTRAGFARIEPIRDTVAVLRYFGKYVLRGGELDFEPRMRMPQP